jgi:hypothetical protein
MSVTGGGEVGEDANENIISVSNGLASPVGVADIGGVENSDMKLLDKNDETISVGELSGLLDAHSDYLGNVTPKDVVE